MKLSVIALLVVASLSYAADPEKPLKVDHVDKHKNDTGNSANYEYFQDLFFPDGTKVPGNKTIHTKEVAGVIVNAPELPCTIKAYLTHWGVQIAVKYGTKVKTGAAFRISKSKYVSTAFYKTDDKNFVPAGSHFVSVGQIEHESDERGSYDQLEKVQIVFDPSKTGGKQGGVRLVSILTWDEADEQDSTKVSEDTFKDEEFRYHGCIVNNPVPFEVDPTKEN